MQIIPAIDVLDGSVVRLLHGRYDAVTTYAEDPVTIAGEWMADGASIVHVVDLDGARFGHPDFDLWYALGKSGVPFQIGGGIRTRESALEALEAGAARIVVGTAALQADGSFEEIVDSAGGTRVVAAIDVRRGRARGSGWTARGSPLGDVVDKVVAAGVEVTLVTSIERDGAMTGPSIDLINEVTAIAPNLAVIASGGVGSIDDIVQLSTSGCEATVVGRALYEGRFTLERAISAAKALH